MQALESELEQSRRHAARASARKTEPRREDQPVGDEQERWHFSPDPLHDTDRYKLVTPYRLPRLD